MKSDAEEKWLNSLVTLAMRDLEETFSVMKKSEHFLKHDHDGEKMASIYFSILSSFVVNQCMDFGATSIICDKDGKLMPRHKRYELMTKEFVKTFGMIAAQIYNFVKEEDERSAKINHKGDLT